MEKSRVGSRWELMSAVQKTNKITKSKQLRQNKKVKAIRYKGGKCELCSVYHNGSNGAIFDFHHIKPEEKEFRISWALRLSWDELQKELDKCMLVCSNCHRRIHNEEY